MIAILEMREHQDKSDSREERGEENEPLSEGSSDGDLARKDPIYSSESDASSVTSQAAEGRGQWGGKLDFIMSSLSLSVGMGNMWRFPYLCYRNGGGAFLIPYVIVAFTLGVPVILLEYVLGQYGQAGVVGVWKVCPLFTGIGWGTFFLSFLGSIYYIILISWCFYYIFASFATDVPWGSCDNPWNTENCVSLKDTIAESACKSDGWFWVNKSCIFTTLPTNATFTIFELANSSKLNKSAEVASTDEYFHREMLGLTDGIDDLGYPQWKIVLCLLLSWAIVFLCLSRGIKSSGKASYVTALFPYFILTLLLVRGLMLDGAGNGLRFFFTPRWEMLASPKVWVDAAVQAFFSLSIAWGGHITLASFNDFKNNCLRDAVIVVVGDTLTSVYGGIVIFSFIGYMAHTMSVEISEVATQGAGLAFIIYPEAVTTLPCPQLWSVLFMVTLINVGIGTEFGLVQTTQATILEALPQSLKKRPTLVLFFLCIICFCLGLPMTTQGGMYVLQLLDAYSATYGMLILSIMTAIALPWVYGTNNLIKNIEEMVGVRLNFVFVIWWRFVQPALMLILLVFSVYDYRPTSYGDYQLPLVCDVIGWLIAVVEFACVPVSAIYLLYISPKAYSILEKIKHLCVPTSSWGPPPQYRRDDPESIYKVPLKGEVINTKIYNPSI